jgi:hypothetical protein
VLEDAAPYAVVAAGAALGAKVVPVVDRDGILLGIVDRAHLLAATGGADSEPS